MDTQPLVSIVMPSYNQAGYIETALDSILEQDWTRLEVIVQDGDSTDGTQQLLKEKSQRDSRVRWASQPDNGPADAINTALGRVRGTVVGWLNSDDCYAKGAISRVVNAFQQHPEWMLCYGEGQHIDASGNLLERYPTLPNAMNSKTIEPDTWALPDKTSFQRGCFICQPTVFFKAVLPRLLGPLDASLGASFDFDYWLRAFKAFEGRIGFVPQIQAYSRLHDDTITHQQRSRVMLEGMTVLARHQGSAPGHWVLSYLYEQRQAGLNEATINQELESLMPLIKPLMQQQQWQTLKKELNR
ncbi:MAG: glycosyltransferase family 2 protein [Pseudomonadota bacterium]